uniref:Putative adaptor protein enigma n=1 Tax=Xenopsylla cheopis TaxID=163159 RepID=A0A6M2DT36_XENCH
MAQLISVRLSRGDACPWGFRLQGGKDFGTPLVIQKVNGGSPAERAGLQAGDAVIKVNNTDVYNLRHKDAQDAIVRAGQSFEVTVQRGGSTWQPQVIPTGMTPKPSPLGSYVTPVTKTSLAAKPQDPLHIGSGHNNKAKPFASVHLNGAGPKNLVNKQYNTPLNIYSEQTIKETLDKHSEVLETGVVGVNFKKNEKIYNAANSEVFKMLQEADNEPETVPHHHTNGTRNKNHILTNHYPIVADLSSPTCEICTRFIVGVFVRIKDKNLHVECFKCSTCGTNLKNQGYYTIHNKLYCDIHAKLAARQNPPPGTEGCIPFTVPPGGKIPVSAISAALAAHSSHPLNGGMAPPPDHAPSTPGYAPVSAPTCDNLHIQVSPSAVNDTNQPAQVSHESNLLVQVAPNDTLTVGSENLERTSLTNNALVKITPYNNELANKCSLTSTLQNITETNTPSNGATINGYRKVLPPNQGGSYKLSGNLSGPKPYSFGAPQASPLSPVSAPLSPYSAPLSPMVSQQQGKFPTSKPGVGFKENMNKSKLPDSKQKNSVSPKVSPTQKIISATPLLEVRSAKRQHPVGEVTLNPESVKALTNVLERHIAKVEFETLERNKNSKGLKNGSSDIIQSKHTKPIVTEKFKPKTGLSDSQSNHITNVIYRMEPVIVQQNEDIRDNKTSDKMEHNNNGYVPLRKPNMTNDSTCGIEHITAQTKISNGGSRTSTSFLTKKTSRPLSYIDNSNNEQNIIERYTPISDTDKINEPKNGNSLDSSTVSNGQENGQYPVCNECKAEIVRGPFISALGRIWCPSHFICSNATCKRPLADIGFVEEQGQLYCEYCFEQFIAPPCDKCHAKIKGDCLNAIGKHFHPECFNCAYCGKLFGNNPFFLEDGQPYCQADWNEMFTTKCFACGFPVEAGDRWVEALSNNYHSQCFNCTMCKKNLEGQSFYAKGGRPFCKNHAR